MAFIGINIQGNILSAEIIEKIRLEDPRFFQKPSDFKLSRNNTVREEINIAWSAAKAHWEAFRVRREKLEVEDTGTTETRQSWIVPLLSELGYELELQRKAEIINDRTYLISHRSINRDEFPVHIAGINQSLDKRAESGPLRLSPHALVQEYLNNHDHLYALVTNGRYLRLLRDATRLSRLSYLEFDLERIMEENLFNEFALLFRLLHITRMPENREEAENSAIEFFHQESLASGSRIREKLSKAVEGAIVSIANGILEHPDNEALRQEIRDGRITPADLYLYLLRLIYRLLFLMVLEERNLIFPESKDDQVRRFRKLYYDYFSLKRFREMALVSIYIDARQHDLWEGMKTTFALFEDEKTGKPLGIKPLGSGLFDPGALGALRNVRLDNATFLSILRILTTFENDNRQLVKVNYGDLDVEEFGSVYEGLLEYDAEITMIGAIPHFSFKLGTGRSKSGSHYTPEELVKPLIQHSLDYLIKDCIERPEKRLNLNIDLPGGRTTGGLKERALLSLKVADVACGSGHILLSAARRIALELARVRTGEEQPSPPALRHATRDVIRNCIYGVDLNPLAVELCKVALWLEAHNPGEPLNFLDHHIKCGDAIVGLAHFEELEKGISTEAFKTMLGDDKAIAEAFRKRNEQERKQKGQLSTYDLSEVDEQLHGIRNANEEVVNMPESNPEEIVAKQQAYNKLISGSRWLRIKQLADIQVGQFFIPKTYENKDRLVTDGIYRNFLNTNTQILGQGPAMATAMAAKKRFFHYFLEFPEIFAHRGFDCILGNPPFLGGLRISKNFSYSYLEFIINNNVGTGGTCDFVGYFFRRAFEIIKEESFISLISTNTIAQGATRKGVLEYLINSKGIIIFAIKSIQWPGQAAVYVSLVSIHKGTWDRKIRLNGKIVKEISSFLDEDNNSAVPFILKENESKSFIGSFVLGQGFIISKKERDFLINSNSLNEQVIFPYIGGDDINSNFDQTPSRYIIFFKEYDEFFCRKHFPEAFEIIEKRVRPEREKVTYSKKAKEKWWIFERSRMDLYERLTNLSKVLVISQNTKPAAFSFIDKDVVVDAKAIAFTFDTYNYFSLLQSSIHTSWAWKFGTTLGVGTLTYTPTEVFQNFPMPQPINNIQLAQLISVGEIYHDHRKRIMWNMKLGLTKTYNLFNCKELRVTVEIEDSLDDKAFEKLIDKEALQLRKHLAKTPGTISFNEAVEGIIKLRELHVNMDQAVLEAYGWHENSEKWGPAIQLRHDFYEIEYLPENDRIRYTIHPEARKEVLKRLLKLNHEIHEEEVRQGLWDKSSSKGKVQSSKSGQQKVRNIEHPEAKPLAADSGDVYKQTRLFDEPNLFSQEEGKKVASGSKVTIRRLSDGQEFLYHITPAAIKGNFTGKHKQILPDSVLAVAMMGLEVGGRFEFGGGEWEVVEVW